MGRGRGMGMGMGMGMGYVLLYVCMSQTLPALPPQFTRLRIKQRSGAFVEERGKREAE